MLICIFPEINFATLIRFRVVVFPIVWKLIQNNFLEQSQQKLISYHSWTVRGFEEEYIYWLLWLHSFISDVFDNNSREKWRSIGLIFHKVFTLNYFRNFNLREIKVFKNFCQLHILASKWFDESFSRNFLKMH